MIKAFSPWVILLILFMWGGNFAITWKPFSISIPAWRSCVGWIAITVGVYFIVHDKTRVARKEGYEDCRGKIIDIIREREEANAAGQPL